jgi:hypothetical protein
MERNVAVRVIHPGVPLGRYLIEVETARVFSLVSNSFQKTKRPRWLFSSLYWPLPAGVSVRRGRWGTGPGKLSVSLPWHRTPRLSMRATCRASFTVYGLSAPVHCASETEANALMGHYRAITTEAVIAVSSCLCRVGMFLGVEFTSVGLLKALTGPLIDASRCRTAPT